MTFEELMRLEDELEIYHLAKLIECCDKVEDKPAKAEKQKAMHLKTLSMRLDRHRSFHGQERNEWLLQRLLKHALR